MPAGQAQRLCPDAVFLRPRFDVYQAVSSKIRALLLDYSELVEPLSLDEAYLDVTASGCCHGSATLIAREIKQRIREHTGLTASAGVSYNKFLAKIASDINKPDGLCVIRPDEAESFIAGLPVCRIHGVGRTTEAKMKALGLERCEDLRNCTLDFLCRHFGKSGEFYFWLARGVDLRQVIPRRQRKSLGSEITFQTDLSDKAVMLAKLMEIATEVLQALAEKAMVGYTLTLKVRYHDFSLVTRSKTLSSAPRQASELRYHLAELLDKTQAGRCKVRLLGVSFSSLAPLENAQEARQLDLFDEEAKTWLTS